MTPDDVVDKTITVTWEAEEISSGAFRQDNGDHMIKCYARGDSIMRESVITVKGEYIMLLLSYDQFMYLLLQLRHHLPLM